MKDLQGLRNRELSLLVVSQRDKVVWYKVDRNMFVLKGLLEVLMRKDKIVSLTSEIDVQFVLEHL